jgi:membrane protein
VEGIAMNAGRRFVSTGKQLWQELSTDDASDFAAGLSYRFLLALFPFFVFVTALGGVVSNFLEVENPSAEILERLGDALPSDARSVLDTQLAGVLDNQRPGLVSIGLVGALWAASGGMGATMKAMNRVYDVEETRPFWKRTALALGLTVLTGAFFITAFVLAVGGQAMATAVADAVGLGDFVRAVMFVARYIFVISLLLGAIAFLYWAAPDAQLPFRWISPGAVMFTVVWIVATLAFGWYVSNFGSYNATYGALGGVIILMIWFYLTAYIMLAGAELNALLAQKNAPEEAEVAQPEPGKWEEPAPARGGARG